MKLYDYQKEGVSFILNNQNVLLADEMGLGKTAQAIVAVEKLNAKKILVICPNSVKYFWVAEIKKWLNEQKIEVIEGNRYQRTIKILSSPKWTIINYESARLHEVLLEMKFDILILDEAHRVKNRKAKTTKFVKKIKAKKVIELTGTPILNSPDELWSLLNIMNKREFRSYWKFAYKYCFVFPMRIGNRVVYKVYGSRDFDKLKQVLEGYMIRRTKKEVLKELPDKIYNTFEVELLPYQKEIYNQMKKLFLAELETEETLFAPSVLAQLTRLRQISISSGLVEEKDEGSKLDEVGNLIFDYPMKTIVYSNFIKSLILLANRLNNISYKFFIGATPLKERNDVQKQFNEGDLDLVLATIQTGGIGVNFSGGERVIFVDRHWTPAINLQAEDRMHRIGTKNPVNVICFYALNTIDYKIQKMLRDKSLTISKILSDKELLREAV